MEAREEEPQPSRVVIRAIKEMAISRFESYHLASQPLQVKKVDFLSYELNVTIS